MGDEFGPFNDPITRIGITIMAVYGNAGPATSSYFKLAKTNISSNDNNASQAIVEAAQLTNLVSMVGWRGFEVIPFGTNAANEVFDVIIQHIGLIDYHGKTGAYSRDVQGDFDRQYLIRNMVTLTCTLGTTADGSAGGFVSDTDFTCDTITENTQSTFGTQLDAAFGQTSTLYSPTGDVVAASYWVPDFGSGDFVRFCFDDIVGDTAADANLLIKLFR